MRQNYEAQTPEEALPAWVLTKREILILKSEATELLGEYRRRPNPRKLRAFANACLKLYSAIRDKVPKVKDAKDLIPLLTPLDKYTAYLPDDPDPEEWGKHYNVLVTAVEAIGVTKITLPSTRAGAELLEGTVMAQYIEEAEDYARKNPI